MTKKIKVKEKDKKRRSISSFSILLVMLITLAIVTIFVSIAGGEGVTSATLANVATAPIIGFTDALPVCLFVIVLGGFLGIVTETGALNVGIETLVRKLKGNELILIPILMFAFSVGGTTYGMWEETVPFYILLAATMVAAGFDSLVGVGAVALGAGTGVLGLTVNPFAVGAAVDSLNKTGIQINQGIILFLGVILWIVTLAIAIFFVMRYAKKVKADKGSTILSLQEQEVMHKKFGESGKKKDSITPDKKDDIASDEKKGAHVAEARKKDVFTTSDRKKKALVGDEKQEDMGLEKVLTGPQKATLIAFLFTFMIMIVGFIPWESFGINIFVDWSSFLTGAPLGQWYFDEASTWFLLMAIAIGFIGGLPEWRFVKAFIAGAGGMMSVVLIIALARSITVLMGETGLDQWILTNAANFLEGVPSIVFAPLSFILYIGLSFLIPSSSGMATVSMPIMGPLTNELGFSVETMIMIFSAGNGLVNLLTPTSGALMGGLAIAAVEYSTWLKFGAKIFITIGIVCVVILTVAMMVL